MKKMGKSFPRKELASRLIPCAAEGNSACVAAGDPQAIDDVSGNISKPDGVEQ